jgi:hypothetical protein
MKNYAAIALIAILLIGCTGGETGQGPLNPFIGGNIAVNLLLQNGAPPPEIFDGGKYPFAFNIVAQNVGESNIGPGTENPYMTMRLDGISPANFGLTSADMQQTLNTRLGGAQKNFDGTILGGQVATFAFDGLNFQPRLVGNDIVTIRAFACYDYSNTAKTTICMKNDILENVQDSTLCSLTGEKQVHNTGGPVHITSVIQNPVDANRIQMNFVVEHVNGGNGEFYGRTDGENCDVSVRNSNKYVVDLEVTANNPGITVNCHRLNGGGRGNITLYNGAPQTVTCTLSDPNSQVRVYTDTVTIKSWYRYGQFVEQPIVVKSVPQ